MVVVVVAVVARLDLTMIVDEGVTGVAAAAEATTALMTMPCAVSGTRAVMAPFVRFDPFSEVDQVMLYEGRRTEERREDQAEITRRTGISMHVGEYRQCEYCLFLLLFSAC